MWQTKVNYIWKSIKQFLTKNIENRAYLPSAAVTVASRSLPLLLRVVLCLLFQVLILRILLHCLLASVFLFQQYKLSYQYKSKQDTAWEFL